MAVSGSVRAYFAMKPCGFTAAVRLYAALWASALLKVAMPRRFESVGLLIPGRSLLRVSLETYEAFVRPRTNDLDIVTPKYEPVTSSWFAVKEGDVVMDVGAHIGRYTLLSARRAAKVIAVEPDPFNHELLQRNVAINGYRNVVLVRAAVSSHAGAARLLCATPENTGRSRLLQASEARPKPERVVDVECVTLDFLQAEHRLDRIDWLKIDVEGHELAVLEGATNCLTRADRIIIEVTRDTEGPCRILLERFGFVPVAREAGEPTYNWLFAREGAGR